MSPTRNGARGLVCSIFPVVSNAKGQIPSRATKDAHGWGVLWLCSCIDPAGMPSFPTLPVIDGFDSYFSSTVAVGVCYRAQAVVDSPGVQELPGGVGNEFRAAIRREFVRYAICGERVS